MDNIWPILIELLILAAFGGLFYLFQRKRIIKRGIEDIYQNLDELIHQLNQSENKEIKSYASELQKLLDDSNLEAIDKKLKEPINGLPEEERNHINYIIQNLQFFLQR